jgi:hypothetical protein
MLPCRSISELLVQGEELHILEPNPVPTIAPIHGLHNKGDPTTQPTLAQTLIQKKYKHKNPTF